MSDKPDEKLLLLKNIALEAGKILMKYFRSDFKIENKEGSELLTTADKESEEFIISAIEKKYPDVEIIAEETKPESDQGKKAFIIDPLDGTNNFSYGIPVFSISLAYQSENNLEIGVVYDPVHEELFFAQKGKRSFLNDSPISVSKRNNLSDSILATGFPYVKKTEKDSNIPEFSSLLMKSRGIRRLGSAALDLCYVACGRLDGYWEKGLKIWDLSAGGLIVEQAGGKVTNFSGNKWDYTRGNIIASNGSIHSEIQKTIKKI